MCTRVYTHTQVYSTQVFTFTTVPEFIHESTQCNIFPIFIGFWIGTTLSCLV